MPALPRPNAVATDSSTRASLRRSLAVAVVEDQPIYRQALVRVCGRGLGWHVIVATGSAINAVDACREHRPDLLVLDLGLEDGDGFWVLERLRESGSVPRALVLTAFCDDYTLVRLERARVAGCLNKGSTSPEDLRAALVCVASGRRFVSETFRRAQAARTEDAHSFDKLLTQQEEVVVTLAGLGFSDAKIGERLHISANTARVHRSHLLHKLRLDGTPRLIAWAVEKGFTRFVRKHT
jgi:DNA-binding NarL/FixJ family response regulator